MEPKESPVRGSRRIREDTLNPQPVDSEGIFDSSACRRFRSRSQTLFKSVGNDSLAGALVPVTFFNEEKTNQKSLFSRSAAERA